MTDLRARTTLGLFGIMIVFVLLAQLMILPSASAQVVRTPRSRDTGSSSQLQAAQGNLQATLEARTTELAATLQSGVNNAAASVTSAVESFSAGATDIAATVQYVATQAAQDLDSIAATVTAISSAFQDLSPEWQALLTALAEQGSIVRDGDSLTATLYISEAQANDLLDLLMEASGYDPASALLDMKADGTIDVILTDISGEFSGTLVMSYQVAVSETGTVTYTLLSATLNGTAIPLDRLPDELTSPINLAIYATVIQPMLGTDTEYQVESIVVSEDGVLLVVTIPLEQ